MKRNVVAAGGCALVMVASCLTAEAQAATPSWLSVQTAKKVTAYNGHRATVKPRAKASGQRVITSLRIKAYRGSKRVASGKTVRLSPGRYRTVTFGTYRAYTITAKTRSRSTTHKAATAAATCTVTRTQTFPDPLGGTSYSSTATCVNAYYPKQPQTDTQTLFPYAVGVTYMKDFPFHDEVVTEKYVARSRKYGRTLHFSSGKRSLRVRNGGHR